MYTWSTDDHEFSDGLPPLALQADELPGLRGEDAGRRDGVEGRGFMGLPGIDPPFSSFRWVKAEMPVLRATYSRLMPRGSTMGGRRACRAEEKGNRSR